ncbi:MAG: toll/interleukin-1 receptor domain-containing protein [Candidatus Cloacimonetes bacterium]|nr:toll/interleukin-1 receptor domain-containing protein [Candidatus Cloacimonadota bacterium]
MEEITLGSLFSASGQHLLMGMGDRFQLRIEGESIPTWMQRHCNAKENSYYLSIYINKKSHNIEAIKQMIEMIDSVLKEIGKGWGGKSKSYDYHWVNIADLTFTGRVFFYSNTYISDIEKEELYHYASEFNLNVEIYDLNYLEIKKRNPVAFISYDHSTKASIVKPLVNRLGKEGLVVWFDEYEIKIGDNISEKIQEGLLKCKKCILIISPEYISNRKWAKREFEHLEALETKDGVNRILPVWHNVTKDEVMQLSLRLGIIKGISTEDFDKLVKELIKVLR